MVGHRRRVESYRIYRSGKGVMPRGKKKRLLLDMHREAQLKATKTLAAIKLSWYWPGITGLVRWLVREFTVLHVGVTPSLCLMVKLQRWLGPTLPVLACLKGSTRTRVGNSSQNCFRHAVSSEAVRRQKLHHIDRKVILWSRD